MSSTISTWFRNPWSVLRNWVCCNLRWCSSFLPKSLTSFWHELLRIFVSLLTFFPLFSNSLLLSEIMRVSHSLIFSRFRCSYKNCFRTRTGQNFPKMNWRVRIVSKFNFLPFLISRSVLRFWLLFVLCFSPVSDKIHPNCFRLRIPSRMWLTTMRGETGC